AVAVRVVALHLLLEPGLDLGRRGVDLEAQRLECLALGIADRTAFGFCRPSLARHGGAVENAERVVPGEAFALAGGAPGTGGSSARSRIHAHAPGRPMPGNRVLLVRDHVVV